jgi:hypothetical protein
MQSGLERRGYKEVGFLREVDEVVRTGNVLISFFLRGCANAIQHCAHLHSFDCIEYLLIRGVHLKQYFAVILFCLEWHSFP